jgi:deazaflavin-dependent oxidoreductase (nitroreductase family)
MARATSPLTLRLSGKRFFPPWAVLHHTGRRSRRAYATPVAVRASADSFTIALPWGDGTQWVRNVLSAGGCSLRWRGEDHVATEPVVIGFAEAAPAFSRVQRAILRVAGVTSFLQLRRSPALGDARPPAGDA